MLPAGLQLAVVSFNNQGMEMSAKRLSVCGLPVQAGVRNLLAGLWIFNYLAAS